jgi:cytochrome P450
MGTDEHGSRNVTEHELSGPPAPVGIEELIWQVQATTGLGHGPLAERATRAGRKIARQSINNIAAGRFEGIPANTVIFALAEALAMPARVIVEAFEVSLGLYAYMPSTMDDADVTIVSLQPLQPERLRVAREQVRMHATAELARLARERAAETRNDQ